MIKPKRAVYGVKPGKSRPVSKNNKIWFQRILVTDYESFTKKHEKHRVFLQFQYDKNKGD